MMESSGPPASPEGDLQQGSVRAGVLSRLFSKCMFPTIRLGYRSSRLGRKRWCSPRTAPTGIRRRSSAATARFISEGYLSASRNADRLPGSSDSWSGRLRPIRSTLRPVVSNYGLHLTAAGDPDMDWMPSHGKPARMASASIRSRVIIGSAPGLGIWVGLGASERLAIAVERLAAIAKEGNKPRNS